MANDGQQTKNSQQENEEQTLSNNCDDPTASRAPRRSLRQSQQSKEKRSEDDSWYKINVIRADEKMDDGVKELSGQQQRSNKDTPQSLTSIVIQDGNVPCSRALEHSSSNKSNRVYAEYVRTLDELDRIQMEKKMIVKGLEVLRGQEEEQKLIEDLDCLYRKEEGIYNRHVEMSLTPRAASQAGEHLLRNGKFTVNLIDFLTRNEAKEYLQNYLFQYFSTQTGIQDDLLVFEQRCKECLREPPKAPQQASEDKSGKSRVQKIEQVRIRVVPGDYDRYQSKENQGFKSTRKRKSERQMPIIRVEAPVQTKSTPAKRHKPDSQSKVSRELKKLGAVFEDVLDPNSLEGTGSADGSNSQWSRKQPDQQQGNEKRKYGSCYHYKILSKGKKDHRKHLLQVRASARLSKKKVNVEEVDLGSLRKGKGKGSTEKQSLSNKNRFSSSQNKQKSPQHSDQSYSPLKNNQNRRRSGRVRQSSQNELEVQEDEETVAVDWIKHHLKELEFDGIQLYEDFKALTKKDRQITKFLLSLERQRKLDEGEQVSVQSDTQSECQGPVHQVEVLEAADPSQPYIHEEQRRMEQNQSQLENNQNNNSNLTNIQGCDHASYLVKSSSNPFSLVTMQRMQDDRPQNEIRPETQLQERSPAIINFEEERHKLLLQKKKKFKIEEEKSFPLMVDKVIDPNLNGHGIYAFVRLSKLTEIELGAKYALTPLAIHYKYSHKAINEDIETAKELAGEFHRQNIAFLPINSVILRMIQRHANKIKKGE